MRKMMFALLLALISCGTSYAICSWTVMYCKDAVCYNKGTGNCDNHGCAAEQIPGGKVTLYDENGAVTNVENYDISQSMSNNCTEAYTNEN